MQQNKSWMEETKKKKKCQNKDHEKNEFSLVCGEKRG